MFTDDRENHSSSPSNDFIISFLEIVVKSEIAINGRKSMPYKIYITLI